MTYVAFQAPLCIATRKMPDDRHREETSRPCDSSLFPIGCTFTTIPPSPLQAHFMRVRDGSSTDSRSKSLRGASEIRRHRRQAQRRWKGGLWFRPAVHGSHHITIGANTSMPAESEWQPGAVLYGHGICEAWWLL